MLNHLEAKSLCLEITSLLKGFRLEAVRSEREMTWVFQFFSNSERQRVLLCLKRPLARFHLTHHRLPDQKSAWTSRVESVLNGAILIQASLLADDRILELELSKHGERFFFVAELFASQAFVLDQNRIILASFPKDQQGEYIIPTSCGQQPEVFRALQTSEEVEAKYDALENEHRFEAGLKTVQSALKRSLKRLVKQEEECLKEIKNAEKWKEMQHSAQLLQNAFHQLKRGMTSIDVEDWDQGGKKITIPLDPAAHPKEHIDALYKKSRKLKKGLPHLEGRLDTCQESQKRIQKALEESASIASEEELATFAKREKIPLDKGKPTSKPKAKERTCYRPFVSKNGYPILVAKSAEDGDRLTFAIAHGSDLWFHVSNVPGSHVVLKVGKGEPPKQEDIREAALLALHYSKAKQSSGEDVTVTERKYVAKPRGAKPGLVTISRHKTLFIKRDDALLNTIKQRNALKAVE